MCVTVTLCSIAKENLHFTKIAMISNCQCGKRCTPCPLAVIRLREGLFMEDTKSDQDLYMANTLRQNHNQVFDARARVCV